MQYAITCPPQTKGRVEMNSMLLYDQQTILKKRSVQSTVVDPAAQEDCWGRSRNSGNDDERTVLF